MKLSPQKLAACAFLCAMTAVCSQILLPLPFTPIPVNLATLAVFLAGGLLGPVGGSWSIVAYLLLGCAGVPVFSGMRGGVGVLAGPTGGYLAGYLLAVAITGLLISRKETKLLPHAFAMTMGLIVCYGVGTLWFMVLTHNSLSSALTMCVLPFLPGDAFKIGASSLLCVRVKKVAGHIIPF